MSKICQRTVEEVVEAATVAGLIPFFSGDDELFLDIDCPSWEMDEKLVEILKGNGFVFESVLTTSSKNGNEHVYCRVNKKMTAVERIALQASLGSDPTKEALSVIRLFTGSDPKAVIALFETEEEAKLVTKWRKQIWEN